MLRSLIGWCKRKNQQLAGIISKSRVIEQLIALAAVVIVTAIFINQKSEAMSMWFFGLPWMWFGIAALIIIAAIVLWKKPAWRAKTQMHWGKAIALVLGIVFAWQFGSWIVEKNAAEKARLAMQSRRAAEAKSAYVQDLPSAISLPKPAFGKKDTTIVGVIQNTSVMYIVPSNCLVRWERVEPKTWYKVWYQFRAGTPWYLDDDRPGDPDIAFDGTVSSIKLSLAQGEKAEIRLITWCTTYNG